MGCLHLAWSVQAGERKVPDREGAAAQLQAFWRVAFVCCGLRFAPHFSPAVLCNLSTIGAYFPHHKAVGFVLLSSIVYFASSSRTFHLCAYSRSIYIYFLYHLSHLRLYLLLLSLSSTCCPYFTPWSNTSRSFLGKAVGTCIVRHLLLLFPMF